MYAWWEVVVKLKKLQKTYCKWSDVFKSLKCWEAEILLISSGVSRF